MKKGTLCDNSVESIFGKNPDFFCFLKHIVKILYVNMRRVQHHSEGVRKYYI